MIICLAKHRLPFVVMKKLTITLFTVTTEVAFTISE